MIISVARKELGDRLRNRWVWTVAALLCISELTIVFFGAAPVGVAGAATGAAAVASLMNLTVYLVPLLALILGCGAIIEEKERGTLDLILVYPLSSGEYFLGTFSGFALALSAAVASGFAVSGLALALWSDVSLKDHLLLTVLALALGCVFLGLSFLISILSRDRGKAVALSVLVWIFAVFVFDLVLVGVLVVSKGAVSEGLFGRFLLLNPTDVFRMLCFKWMGGATSALGLSVAILFVPPPATLLGALALWMGVPLFLSYVLFQRRVASDTLG